MKVLRRCKLILRRKKYYKSGLKIFLHFIHISLGVDSKVEKHANTS
jgi:hypothetical protein